MRRAPQTVSAHQVLTWASELGVGGIGLSGACLQLTVVGGHAPTWMHGQVPSGVGLGGQFDLISYTSRGPPLRKGHG